MPIHKRVDVREDVNDDPETVREVKDVRKYRTGYNESIPDPTVDNEVPRELHRDKETND